MPAPGSQLIGHKELQEVMAQWAAEEETDHSHRAAPLGRGGALSTGLSPPKQCPLLRLGVTAPLLLPQSTAQAFANSSFINLSWSYLTLSMPSAVS